MKCPKCGYEHKTTRMALGYRVKRLLKYMIKYDAPIFPALIDKSIAEIQKYDDELPFAIDNKLVEKTDDGFLCTKAGIEFANT
jgi:hypothetical protein